MLFASPCIWSSIPRDQQDKEKQRKCARSLGRLPVACSELSSCYLPFLPQLWCGESTAGGGGRRHLLPHTQLLETLANLHIHSVLKLQSVLGPCACVQGGLIVVMLCLVRLVTSLLGRVKN